MNSSEYEVEIKLVPPAGTSFAELLQNLKLAGVRLHPRGNKDCTDCYYDSQDWRLFRGGYALRHRQLQEHGVLTMKALTASQGNWAVREEFEALCEAAHIRHPDRWPPLIRSKAEPILDRVPLRLLFEIRQRRQVFDAQIEAELCFEVSVDRVKYQQRKNSFSSHTLHLVELELKKGSKNAFQSWVNVFLESTGWIPYKESKFEFGLSFFELDPPC